MPSNSWLTAAASCSSVLSLALLILSQPPLNQTSVAPESTPYDCYLTALDYEEAGQYDDALETFHYIVDNYPTDSIAGEAWREIIDIYIQGYEVAKTVAAVEQLKDRMEQNPEIYKGAYGWGLAQLYNYYYAIGDEVEAEKYAKKMQSELGTMEYIEELERRKLESDTTIRVVNSIEDQREEIKEHKRRIETLEPQSTRRPSPYLPELLFKLSELLIQDKDYSDAAEVLLYLKHWPDQKAVKGMMPEISYKLAKVYLEVEMYEEALGEFRGLLDCHTDSDFYKEHADEIYQYTEECEKKIAPLE